jgi:hypothetical protein
MTPFETYVMYLAIKAHFSSTYDYHKYGGKMRVTQSSFESRKDKYMFYKLSKRDNIEEYLVANLFEKPTMWVGDLFDPACVTRCTEYMKRKQALSYTFRNDLDALLDNFDENFKVVKGEYPYLLKLLVQKKISYESFIILNDCVGFFGHWNKHINDPVQWPQLANKCRKLFPFLSYDKDKYVAMIKQKFC